ncbi:ABC transporter substrate-binding protein [Actinotalea sp. C106]|uniref:ABC transporter substrate-binding protein n=1 Tax=Actinotalea sp. C106 TaxID=2908644 RepID=UPI0020296DFB|nr:ABC transporter substrate-binding protein [Actinotalea sp. C106]
MTTCHPTSRPTTRPTTRQLARWATPAAAVLLLSACTSTDATTPTTSEVDGAEVTAEQVSVQNCGRTVTLDEPAQRIVSGWTTSTEVLLAVDQGDRLVGQYNSSNGTPSEEYADAFAEIPVLSATALSREQLAAAQPDLIWADGEYLFDGSQLPTIDELASQGTQVLVLSGFCGDDATAATVEDVFTDLDAIGTLLGESSATEVLADQLRERLQAVETRIADQPESPLVFLADYEGVLYTYDGVYTDIAEKAGGHNLYAGELPPGQYYSEISREDVLTRDPGTIVLLTGPGADTEAAVAGLSELLPGVTAVSEGRVVTMPESDSTNLRVVDGVERLSQALHP